MRCAEGKQEEKSRGKDSLHDELCKTQWENVRCAVDDEKVTMYATFQVLCNKETLARKGCTTLANFRSSNKEGFISREYYWETQISLSIRKDIMSSIFFYAQPQARNFLLLRDYFVIRVLSFSTAYFKPSLSVSSSYYENFFAINSILSPRVLGKKWKTFLACPSHISTEIDI